MKNLFRASESPIGFAMIAGAGLALVLILQTLGGGSDAEQQVTGTEEATGQQTSLSAAGEHATPAEATEENQPEPEPALVENIYKLRRNETLISLMRRAGIENRDAHAMVNQLKDVTNLRRLQRGQEIRITRLSGAGETDGTFQTLRMRDNFDSEAQVRHTDSGFIAERTNVPTIGLTHLVEGEITDSLYMSAQRAGLPTPVIVELIRLMSFDVDFEREIRIGDRFQVYFERSYAPGYGDLDEGRILQVRLELRKRTLEANYFVDANGDGDYFDAAGNSTRKALMKTPLDVTVVTSSYGRRRHPVLGYTRMHKGVDFRARTGTPIMAAGDGVVERASRYGAYGNYIRIRHNSTYSTAYAHLSRYGRGVKKGARVKQGQIIGYAGATGRVTAAHLHYEVMMNGKQVNPLTIDLPTGRSLKDQDLVTYTAERTQLLADIDMVLMQRDIMAAAQATQTAAVSNTEDSAIAVGDR